MEPLSYCSHTFGSIESDRREVQRLQKAQMEYGVYACIPGTQHTYEEVIQSLVGLDLRRQYEARRQRNHTYSPKRHQTITVKRRNKKETPDETRERAIQQDVCPNQAIYTIHEVAQRSGLSIPTLRYYEEIGLVPDAWRDPSSGHRRYCADTLQLLESLANLRAVGMSIEEMRTYLALRAQGDETAVEKRDLFQAHAEEVEKQIAWLHIRQRYLSLKVAYWDAWARGDLDEAARVAQEYESIVKNVR